MHLKKIICYTVFKSPICDLRAYALGAIHNAVLLPSIYPDYTGVFYVQSDLTRLSAILTELGAHVYHCARERAFIPLLWRFYPIFYSTYEIALFRDADSRLSLREHGLVKAFEQSNYTCHSIIDSPLHKRPLMAGMWGTKPIDGQPLQDAINDIRTSYGTYPFKGKQNFVDEAMLQKIVWPLVKSKTLTHNSLVDDTLFAKGEAIGTKHCNVDRILQHKELTKLVDNNLLKELNNAPSCMLFE